MRTLSRVMSCSFAAVALLSNSVAQRGDRPGQKQEMLPDDVAVPSAPARTPNEERATLHIVDGLQVQLFAAEPLVKDPVVATFDAAGRMWVAEFTNYMLDIDATDEQKPTGRIVVLHDDDQDGVADRSTVFADQLVLPRAVLPMRGGALVVTPPNLVWMPDADGDLRADSSEKIMGGFEAGTGNPEHSGNGLIWGFDHRIHLCNDRRMLRRTDAGFVVESGAGGGQWGMCLDDRGRFYFNYNSDWLRCDLVPTHYGERARKVGGIPALNHRVVKDQSVWPIRMTPGVNRGYQKGLLKDYRLARTTAVCSPLVYRGGLLPFDGDAFVCEPAGNLIRRFKITDGDGLMRGDNAYAAGKREFLASTDERFRPVNMTNGPDGALYVVDMYRGVIQHRNYVTSFLRHQVEKRKLEKPVHLGRIWRIVPKDHKSILKMPALVDVEAKKLVRQLAHQSGTVRDLALQEIVQRNLQEAAPELRQLLLTAKKPKVAIAALSALQGIGSLTATELRRCVRSRDAGVAAFALQHVGAELARGDRHLWAAIESFGAESSKSLRWQAALAIGDALMAEPSPKDRVRGWAYKHLARFLVADPDDRVLVAAVATAAHPNVASVLRCIDPSLTSNKLRRVEAELAQRAFKSRDVSAQRELLKLASSAGRGMLQQAVLQGAIKALPKGARRAGWLALGRAPESLVSLSASDDGRVRRQAQELLGAVRISGRAVVGAVTNLSDDERSRVKHGEVLFRGACAACHQLDGRGQRGLAPPLRDSEWVTGVSSRLIRIALHGVKGPIEVDGEIYELEMPGQGHLSDIELARVLSYLRRAFGHQASCIDKTAVQKVRKATNQRASAWTAPELLKTK
jgi:mono/diheme cytochrome c family protein/glucose/arabinose dehydrogenase